jgi:hypothetical protein
MENHGSGPPFCNISFKIVILFDFAYQEKFATSRAAALESAGNHWFTKTSTGRFQATFGPSDELFKAHPQLVRGRIGQSGRGQEWAGRSFGSKILSTSRHWGDDAFPTRRTQLTSALALSMLTMNSSKRDNILLCQCLRQVTGNGHVTRGGMVVQLPPAMQDPAKRPCQLALVFCVDVVSAWPERHDQNS